jgi:hypothetical protein
MKKKPAVPLLLIVGIIFSFPINSPASQQAAKQENLPVQTDAFSLLTALLKNTGTKEDKTTTAISDIKKFMDLYTKFYDRPQLLSGEVLSLMAAKYEKYNVLVDFIEKIPIQKPETVIKLFLWVENFEWFPPKDKSLFNSVFQSILELISHAAIYSNSRRDYDALLEKLIAIPFARHTLYDNLFDFFKSELEIDYGEKNLLDFVTEGIKNRDLEIDGTDYSFHVNESYKKNILQILDSQEICSFTTLLKLNHLFRQLTAERGDLSAAGRTFKSIEETCTTLPYAEISKDAPKDIRDRVMTYSRDKLSKELDKLFKALNDNAEMNLIQTIINKIKTEYLLHQLDHHLLAMAYAVNAKSPKLKVFLNPNMVRLHDFLDNKERTAWNFCGTPPVTDYLGGYHLSGGLSRLNIVFAFKWYEHLFGRTFIYNPPHLQAVLVNLLDLYPIPRTNWKTDYNALMVDFGLELMRKARNSKDDEVLRKDVINRLGTITTGFHYRKAVDYINEKSVDHDLFFKELKLLAEYFFKNKKYLDTSTYKKQLEKLPISPAIPPGSIYYFTFGNLNPQTFNMFPQDISNFFDSGRLSGEIFDEYKIKLDWHLHKKKIHPILAGQILYSYLNGTAPRILSQNHVNDYFSTYFLFKVFNNSHLRGIVKKLQKEGYLKLK